MRIRDLEGLLEAARQGSIAKASDILHISHTALSKQIRSLEAYYGVKLLRRSPVGVEPTDAGRHLIERTSALLAQFEAVHRELGEYREPASFVVGALPSLAASLLPERVLAMRKDGIDARVHVRPTSEDLWRDLRDGTVDGIVAEIASDAPAGIFQATLFTEPLLAVVPGTHRLNGRTHIDVEELAEEPLLLHPPACGIRKWVEAAWARSGSVPAIVSEVAFDGFIAGMVAAGAGITVLPESAASRLREPGVSAVPIAGAQASRTIVMATARADWGRSLLGYMRG